jgi:hypothetical protein
MNEMFVDIQTDIKAVRANAKVAPIEFSSGILQCAAGSTLVDGAQCGAALARVNKRFLRHRATCPECAGDAQVGQECGSSNLSTQSDLATCPNSTCANTCTPDWIAFHVYGCEADIQDQFGVIDDAMTGSTTANLVAPIAVTETAVGDPRRTCNNLTQGDGAELDNFAYINMNSWITSVRTATQNPLLVEWLFMSDEDPDRCNDWDPDAGEDPTDGTPCTAEATCDALGDYDCSVRSGIFSSMGAMFNRTATPRTYNNKTNMKAEWEQINDIYGTTAVVTMSAARTCTATFSSSPASDWEWIWNWSWD